MLTLNLFGGFQLRFDDQLVDNLGGDKGRALLAYLGLEDERPHERQALAALLWPEITDSEARNRLRVTLSRLRSGLSDLVEQIGGELLLTDRDNVQINPEVGLIVDARTFSRLLKECERHEHRSMVACYTCRSRLEEAILLYNGDFLQHFALLDAISFDEWMSLNKERFQLDVIRAMEVLADYHLRRGESLLAVKYARLQLAHEPWRESAYRQLIYALALGGQRGEAMAQYQICQQILESEFGASPSPATTALYERIQRAELGTGHLGPAHNLPVPSTPLVGRQAEMEQVLERLSDPDARIVTISGPGGVGKSRLAIEIAWETLGTYVHGVWWISLTESSSIEEPGGSSENPLVSAIATALDVDFSTYEELDLQVRRYLRDRNILLILDNFEHLVGKSSQWIAQLLREAHQLVIMVTTRQRLNLHNEWILSLNGLQALPENINWTEDQALPPAVELFYERALMVNRQLSLEKDTLDLVVKICVLLDGLPLGVELAAAWTPLMSLSEIASSIEGDLDFLSSERSEISTRHRSLRAVFNSSWERLSPDVKRAFAGLSIFKGQFERAAAEQIVEIGREEFSALEQRSLLQVAPDGRLSLHARLRGYAAEKINSLPNLDDLRMRHSQYYLGCLAGFRESLYHRNPYPILEAIRADWEEYRAAWIWALEASVVSLLSSCVRPLARFERLSGWSLDVMRLMENSIDVLSRYGERASKQAIRLQAELVLAQVELTRHRGEFLKSLRYCQESLRLGQSIGEPAVTHWAICQIAELNTELGNLDEAAVHLTRLDSEPELGSGVRARLSFGWGVLAVKHGDLHKADAFLQDALAYYRGVEDALMELSVTKWSFAVQFLSGRFEESLRLAQSHLELARALGDRFTEVDALKNLGLVFLELGDLRQSRPLFDSALALSLEIRHTQAQAETLMLHGRFWQYQGDLGNAYHYLDHASLTFAGLGLRFNEMEAELALGEVYLQAGHSQVAADRLSAALEYFKTNRGRDQINRARAGLALLAAAEGQVDEALKQVDALLPELNRSAMQLYVHLSIIQTLIAIGDSRSVEILERTRSLLQARSEKIQDPIIRRSYLENVPAHREIMALELQV